MALGSFFFHKPEDALQMGAVRMLLEELEVLADEPVRETSGYAYLVNRELLFVE